MASSSAVETDQVRTAVRFPMKLALQVKTASGVIEAVTENISANGILFTGKELPDVQSQIEFSVKMPAEVMGTPGRRGDSLYWAGRTASKKGR